MSCLTENVVPFPKRSDDGITLTELRLLLCFEPSPWPDVIDPLLILRICFVHFLIADAISFSVAWLVPAVRSYYLIFFHRPVLHGYSSHLYYPVA